MYSDGDLEDSLIMILVEGFIFCIDDFCCKDVMIF